MEDINMRWYDVNVTKPTVCDLDCVDVLVYCKGIVYKASYIKHNDEKNGRFYIDMNWPKKIFENITEHVTMWCYINLPVDINLKYSEFRIKEYNGEFVILKQFKENTGTLFHAKNKINTSKRLISHSTPLDFICCWAQLMLWQYFQIGEQ